MTPAGGPGKHTVIAAAKKAMKARFDTGDSSSDSDEKDAKKGSPANSEDLPRFERS